MTSPQTADPKQTGDPEAAGRRTQLAVERTQLAWWRTGLTALAVGVGIGRVVPELGDGITEWPYVALGVAFALYGLLMIAFGYGRAGAGGAALGTAAAHSALVLAVGGVALAFATCLLILLG